MTLGKLIINLNSRGYEIDFDEVGDKYETCCHRITIHRGNRHARQEIPKFHIDASNLSVDDIFIEVITEMMFNYFGEVVAH